MSNYITYGYHLVDGYTRINPEQSGVVHPIFDVYGGGESVKKIVGMPKDRKAPATRGKPSWTPAPIRKISRNKGRLGVEPYPGMTEGEQLDRVQECLKRSRDLQNQRHSAGSIWGTPIYTGRLIRNNHGGVYVIHKQSNRCDDRNARYWKCRHYGPITKEPCKMPIVTEKQLDGIFSQALMRMKTESTLYHEETKKVLKGPIKERQRMESELSVCWNRCNKDDERIERLYLQTVARRYREIKVAGLTCQIEDYLRGLDGSIRAGKAGPPIFRIIRRVKVQPGGSSRFQPINNMTVLQYPETKTIKDKKSKNIHYCVPFGYWLGGQETSVVRE